MMKYEEAIGWLKGERSMCNSFGRDDESQARLAEADAGCTQQAYWTVKAYKEGLIPKPIDEHDTMIILQVEYNKMTGESAVMVICFHKKGA